MLEITDSLLAPRDKLTGQGLTFIAHTVRELLTVCEGSTSTYYRYSTVDVTSQSYKFLSNTLAS